MAGALISTELTIVGDLTCEGSIDIQGRIEGDVVASRIEVLAGGQLVGSVEADKFIVRGQYHGDATCSSMAISADATVQSNIVAQRLSCESGSLWRLKVFTGVVGLSRQDGPETH